MDTDSRTPEQLAAFCDAMRAKPEWYRKILDRSRGLAEKWAGEAQLLKHAELVPLLEELKSEARRIRARDFTICLTPTPPPYQLTVDSSIIDADVRTALEYARGAKHAIRVPALRDLDLGVFVSDGLVPAALHKELSGALDALADIEPKDFHPGTNGKVQDLIHPSLYPYIADVTPIEDTATRPPHPYGLFTTEIRRETQTEYKTKYAWLPSVFRVSEDGTDAHITSYINGLGPRERFPTLYRLIEQVFLLVLPHFEYTTDFQFKHEESNSVLRWRDRRRVREQTTRAEWGEVLEKQREQKAMEAAAWEKRNVADQAEDHQERSNIGQFAGTDVSSSFKGQDLKVIVKAANYCLKPGESYEGTWHLEGMPHERIVASAIYYYDADEAIVDRGLGLRRSRDADKDFPIVSESHANGFFVNMQDDKKDDDDVYDDRWDYPSDWEEVPDEDGVMGPMSLGELSASIALGTVPTTNVDGSGKGGTGRILTFPNWIQHRVEGVSNSATVTEETRNVVSRRKILCFFLVDDDPDAVDDGELTLPGFVYIGLDKNHVLTTADVPPQARATNLPTLRFLLPMVCERYTGKRLPQELVERIVRSADLGLTWEEAEATRREFMTDRRAVAHGVMQETYSLCEH